MKKHSGHVAVVHQERRGRDVGSVSPHLIDCQNSDLDKSKMLSTLKRRMMKSYGERPDYSAECFSSFLEGRFWSIVYSAHGTKPISSPEPPAVDDFLSLLETSRRRVDKMSAFRLTTTPVVR